MAVFLFPGRSARYPEMISRIIDAWPVASEIISYASRILERDLHRQYRSDNLAMFASERDIEVGVFLASHLHLRALEANGAHADISVGMGVGELNHLVHIGALTFDDALRLVNSRGAARAKSPPGAMMLITSLPTAELEAVLPSVRPLGVAEVAMYLSPDQNVIAGERVALDALGKLVRRTWPSATATIVNEETPAYTSLMRSAGEEMRPALLAANWKLAAHPYIPDVLGMPVIAYTAEMYADLLSRQVYSPIRWREALEYVASHTPNPVFVLVGPRSAGIDLIPNNWIGSRLMETDRPGDLAKSVAGAALEIARTE